MRTSKCQVSVPAPAFNQSINIYRHDIVLHPSYCHYKFINPPKHLQNSTNAYNVGSLVKQRWQYPSRSIHRRKKKMMNDACLLHCKSWCWCFVPARSCCCCCCRLTNVFMSFQKSLTQLGGHCCDVSLEFVVQCALVQPRSRHLWAVQIRDPSVKTTCAPPLT